MRCRDCGRPLHQRPEKALSGEWAMVWADQHDAWVCEATGDEHRVLGEPGHWEGTDEVEGHVVKERFVTEAAPGAFIVVEGNPVDGFVFHGIPAFPDANAAVDWAVENCTADWWTAPLQDVEES